MSFPRVPFDTPYFDPTGLGFQPPKLTGLAWRAFTIVTICFDPQEREALFINADGYAVPLEPHPYELRRLLERAIAHEYGQVCGAGQFAMKPGRISALQSSGQLKRWVVYHLEQPAHYANEPTAWHAYVESDLAEERRAAEATADAVAHLVRLPWQETPAPCAARVVEERRAELMAQYRSRKAENDAVNAWLRGDAPSAPLLQALTS